MSCHGREVRHPFLDRRVMAYLCGLPLHRKMDLAQRPGEGDKRILRQVARRLGMAQTAGNVKRAIQVSSPCVRSVGGAHPSRSLGRARRRWAPATGASRGTRGWTEPVRATTTAPPLSPPLPPLYHYHCAASPKRCLQLGSSIVIANAATVSRLRPLQGVRQRSASNRKPARGRVWRPMMVACASARPAPHVPPLRRRISTHLAVLRPPAAACPRRQPARARTARRSRG